MHPNAKKLIKITLIITLSLVLGGSIFIGVADEIIFGSVTVDPPTEIENIFLNDGISTITSVDPDATTVYFLNFTVNRPAGMKDIEYVDVYWHTDTYASNYNSSAVDIAELVHARWIENENNLWILFDIWQYDPGQTNGTWDSEWQFGPGTSPGVDSSATAFEFVMPFIVSRAAVPASTWQVTIDVTWDDASSISASSANWSVTTQQSLSVSSNTLAWGTVEQGTGSVTASINVSLYSNAQWSLQIQAIEFTASGEPSVSIDSGAFVIVNSVDTLTSTFSDLTGYSSQAPMGESDPVTSTLVFSFDPTNWSGSYGVEYTVEITLKLLTV